MLSYYINRKERQKQTKDRIWNQEWDIAVTGLTMLVWEGNLEDFGTRTRKVVEPFKWA